MDRLELRDDRAIANSYLPPAAIGPWKSVAKDVNKACLDEMIESGRL